MAKTALYKKYDQADRRLKRISATIGAFVAITGALTGALSWVQTQFTNAVSAQISGFRDETREANRQHEETVTRVELIELMEHDPDNIAAIEKTAKYYFKDLGGNSYMLQKYSDWAKAYGGDITLIIGTQ